LADEDAAAYLFLSLLQARVGGSFVARLGERPIRSILEAAPADISREMGLTERASRAFADLRSEFDAALIRDRLDREGVRVVTLGDESYPGKLRLAPDPPPALFVRGRLGGGTSIAVVGSRRATPAALEAARDLGMALVAGGAVVVSGLAAGVDAAAHEGALAGGGGTVGVLGCGIDVVYPRSNRKLFGRVAATGAVVSEYYLGEAPLAWRFPARNRIIAGLSDVVVVVEAPEKSGALITARHALDAGRDVWAVPGPAGAAECRGSNRLLADGAGVLWDVGEFVSSVVGGSAAGTGEPVTPTEAVVPDETVGLPDEEAAVLRGVDFRSAGADVVAGRIGVEMRAVLSSLAMLELKGYVSRDAAGNFARRAGS
jgi:DNA processing protein